MKHTSYARIIAAIACAFALALALGGCATSRTGSSTSSSGLGSTSSSSTSTDQQAAQNRQYMATLNQQMSDLQTATDSFQKAVAAKDVVSMNAAVANVQKIVDSVKNTDATERLQTVKDGYVDGLCTLDDAMKAYVSLYTDVQNGAVDGTAYANRLKDVQAAYDNGIAKLQSADEEVQKIASE